jgi:hypothetical protein
VSVGTSRRPIGEGEHHRPVLALGLAEVLALLRCPKFTTLMGQRVPKSDEMPHLIGRDGNAELIAEEGGELVPTLRVTCLVNLEREAVPTCRWP